MTLARAFGLTPDAARALSLADAVLMLIAAREADRDRVRLAGFLLDGMKNYAFRAMQGGEWTPMGTHAAAFLGEPPPEPERARLSDEERARLHERAAEHRRRRRERGFAPPSGSA